MFSKQKYPILEFDPNKTAVIEPTNIIKKIDMPEYCVISFFREVINKKAKRDDYKQIREIACNQEALSVIESVFNEKAIKYIKAKTWTTDAFYRETQDKVELRKSEGCVTVEMEAAAFFAVSQFRNVMLGQILYGGDDLSGDEWDNRFWQSREGIRENLVDLSMEICLKL